MTLDCCEFELRLDCGRGARPADPAAITLAKLAEAAFDGGTTWLGDYNPLPPPLFTLARPPLIAAPTPSRSILLIDDEQCNGGVFNNGVYRPVDPRSAKVCSYE